MDLPLDLLVIGTVEILWKQQWLGAGCLFIKSQNLAPGQGVDGSQQIVHSQQIEAILCLVHPGFPNNSFLNNYLFT